MSKETKIKTKKTGSLKEATIIKGLRESLSLSQAKLGKLLGISAQQVWNIEHQYYGISKYVQKKIDEIQKTDDDETRTTTIPLLPSFPAGDPATVFSDIGELEYISFPEKFLRGRNKRKIVCFPLNGESMNEVFPAGSWLLAERYDGGREIRHGQIGLFYLKTEGTHTVKQFLKGARKSEGILMPRSTVRTYLPRTVSLRDLVVEAVVFRYIGPEIK